MEHKKFSGVVMIFTLSHNLPKLDQLFFFKLYQNTSVQDHYIQITRDKSIAVK